MAPEHVSLASNMTTCGGFSRCSFAQSKMVLAKDVPVIPLPMITISEYSGTRTLGPALWQDIEEGGTIQYDWQGFGNGSPGDRSMRRTTWSNGGNTSLRPPTIVKSVSCRRWYTVDIVDPISSDTVKDYAISSSHLRFMMFLWIQDLKDLAGLGNVLEC